MLWIPLAIFAIFIQVPSLSEEKNSVPRECTLIY